MAITGSIKDQQGACLNPRASCDCRGSFGLEDVRTNSSPAVVDFEGRL